MRFGSIRSQVVDNPRLAVRIYRFGQGHKIVRGVTRWFQVRMRAQRSFSTPIVSVACLKHVCSVQVVPVTRTAVCTSTSECKRTIADWRHPSRAPWPHGKRSRPSQQHPARSEHARDGIGDGRTGCDGPDVATLREPMGMCEAALASIELQFYTFKKTVTNEGPTRQFSARSTRVPGQVRSHGNVIVFILSIHSVYSRHDVEWNIIAFSRSSRNP
jgi:hypothetical protein